MVPHHHPTEKMATSRAASDRLFPPVAEMDLAQLEAEKKRDYTGIMAFTMCVHSLPLAVYIGWALATGVSTQTWLLTAAPLAVFMPLAACICRISLKSLDGGALNVLAWILVIFSVISIYTTATEGSDNAFINNLPPFMRILTLVTHVLFLGVYLAVARYGRVGLELGRRAETSEPKMDTV